MKIAVEIGWGHKKGGARRVAINTLMEMYRLCPDNQYLVFSNCEHKDFRNTAIACKTLSPPAFMPQVIWDQFIFPHVVLPFAVSKTKPDVTYYTNNIISFFGNRPCVVTIHDMTPFVLPESFMYCHALYQRAYVRFAAQKATKIITVSENSKRDICRILRVNEKKIVIIPNASNFAKNIDSVDKLNNDLWAKTNISSPFILYAGAIHPRKNIRRIIEAYCQLKTYKKIPHQLIIAGSMRWKKRETIPQDTLNKIKNHVIFTGPVSDNDLVSLYKNCDVFVCPSLYEGFGLPVLEAMSLGAPVVTSNTSSLPEVAGDAAVLVDPTNVDEIVQGMWSVISDPKLANELRSKGLKQASKFSWEKTAKKVLEVLESVV